LEEGADEPDAGSDLLTEVTTGLVVLVPLIAPLVDQGTGQGLSSDVVVPVVADGETGPSGLLPISQGASAGEGETGAAAFTALLPGAGSQDALGPEAQASAPNARSSGAPLPDAVQQPDGPDEQVADSSVLNEVGIGETGLSVRQKTGSDAVFKAPGEFTQVAAGQANPVLNENKDRPGAGHGPDSAVQTLSQEAPQSLTGDQFLEGHGGRGDQEGGARQGQGEGQGAIMAAPSPLDGPAHGAEVVVRSGEAPFRSELTKAAERAVPAPVESPAAVVSNSGGTMRLQFEPPDLGRVTVQVTVQAQQVHATLSVQHHGLGEILATSQGALDDAMRQHGLRVGEFRVDTDTEPAGQGQQFGEPLPGFQDREDGRSSGRPEGSDPSLVEVGPGENPDRGLSLNRINVFA
jgi:flagellar hook-length control protein FliK